jgi:AcrR family transcriptional regulator
VQAGAHLFVERGFGLTTIDDIAAEAGVSRKTVFTSVGGKVDILKLAIDWAIVGDDEPIPLMERAPIRRAEAKNDPDETIRTWVDLNCEIGGRIAGLIRALHAAAGTDPQAAELLDASNRQRVLGFRAFAQTLANQGGLREGLTVEEAADIVYVHGDPTTVYKLVTERGWSIEAYRDWLYQTMLYHLRGITTASPAPP